MKGVKALLDKLSIGNLLKIKADVQGLTIVSTAEDVDKVYSMEWASNVASVTKLLLD